jgi:uncharacterized membrane protein YgcG
MLQTRRWVRHLTASHLRLRRAFSAESLLAIEREIQSLERQHSGEVRFAVECALPLSWLLRSGTPRARAIELFSKQRLWDTSERNGVLIYLLLADRSVEIIADRGLNAQVNETDWKEICQSMEWAFRKGQFKDGAIRGVRAISALLPRRGESPYRRNEIDDKVLVL